MRKTPASINARAKAGGRRRSASMVSAASLICGASASTAGKTRVASALSSVCIGPLLIKRKIHQKSPHSQRPALDLDHGASLQLLVLADEKVTHAALAGLTLLSHRRMASLLHGRKNAKHLDELKIQVSIKVVSSGRRLNSAIAPTRQHQFSTSCCPLSSIAASG